MIHAIFFDATETLIHIPRGVAYHYREVALKHGLVFDEDALRTAFRSAWKTMPPRVAMETSRPDDDKGWWRELVARVFKECNACISDAVFERSFEELYAHFTLPGVWDLYPDVVPTLDRLHGKYSLGVISNFDRRLYTILKQLGLARFFAAIVVSSEAGADKPHPQIFQRALK